MTRKHMTEAMLEMLMAVHPQPMRADSVEALAALMGVDMDSRNAGGWPDLLLQSAGLIVMEHNGYHMTYRLSEYGWEIVAEGRNYRDL